MLSKALERSNKISAVSLFISMASRRPKHVKMSILTFPEREREREREREH